MVIRFDMNYLKYDFGGLYVRINTENTLHSVHCYP